MHTSMLCCEKLLHGKRARLAGFLVVYLLLVSTAMAVVSIVPASGRVQVELQTACYNVSTAASERVSTVAVQDVTVAGDLDDTGLYPFFVERFVNSNEEQSLYLPGTKTYVTSAATGCVVLTRDDTLSDDEVLWGTLRTLFLMPPGTATTASNARGISSLSTAAASATLTVPVSFGGDGKAHTFNVVFQLNDPKWSINFVTVSRMPLSILLQQTSDADTTYLECQLTLPFFGSNVTSSLDFSTPTACTSSSDTTTTTKAPEEDDADTMPSFPPEFTATFQVIMPDQKEVYSMWESYSSYENFNHAVVRSVHADVVGRVFSYEWYINGQTQMSYFRQQKGVPKGNEVIDPVLRSFFWPDIDTCSRALIGYDVLASSTNTLLLYSRNSPPVFLGNRTVRGIPCAAYAAMVDGSRVTWYWATNGTTFPSSTAASVKVEYGNLMRIVVDGLGAAPALFTHHPFFAQGYAFPKEDRFAACATMDPWVPLGCMGIRGTDDPYQVIYDITSFVPYVLAEDNAVPETCRKVHTSASFPSTSCYLQGGIPPGGVAVLLIIVALLFLLLGSCCVWCRFAPMVRALQEELVNVAEELRRQTCARDQVNADMTSPPTTAALQGKSSPVTL